MTKEKLIGRLEQIKAKYGGDQEAAHMYADEALLEYIDDNDISEAYEAIDKWYA